jgi:hypothetical protein
MNECVCVCVCVCRQRERERLFFVLLKIIQIWRYCEILMQLNLVLATFKPQINRNL